MEPEIKAKVIEVLASGQHQYYSLPSLSAITGVAPAALQPALEAEKKDIRQSQLTAPDGSPLYMLNTPLSGVADIWNAARYFTYLKTK